MPLNKEQVHAKNQEYWKKHRLEILARRKLAYPEKREKILAQQRARRPFHMEKIRAQSIRDYYNTPVFVRQARSAIATAIRKGAIVRPETCDHCHKPPVRGKVEAHHYMGYAKKYQLVVQWLCPRCHALADRAFGL